LDQAGSGTALLPNPLQDMLHERTPDGAILHGWVNGDWADTGNQRPFVHKVTANDPTIEFGDHPVYVRVGEKFG
jgi:hypothetical protein